MKSSSKRPIFELTRLSEYTDDSILEEIRRVAKLGLAPRLSRKIFEENSRVGVTTIYRRFGSWSAALSAAGLGHLAHAVVPATKSRTLARGMSDDEILNEILRVANHLGLDSLSVAQFRHHSTFGPDAVRSRFKTWNNALRQAGLKPVAMGRRYSDAECFENLLIVWTHYGRPPTYLEMGANPSTVGGKAYTIRWKTWNKALAAFVEYVNTDHPTEDAQTPAETCSTAKDRLPPERRRDIPISLRYRVHRRDRFRCVICGKSPATDLECRLHVDHIHPWSKGGLTVEENLRSLCATCNLGKGDSIEAGELLRK